MIFQHVESRDQNLVDSTKTYTDTIRGYCGYLLEGLSKFFALDHNRVKYDVVFSSDDQLLSVISTPFGKARGRLAVQIVDGDVAGRYVFEKSVVSSEGKEIWIAIWAIRILRNGNVLLGDEGNIEIEVANPGPYSNAISAPAKSLLYRIAITPTFQD
ncbi:hypothetical protein EY04_17235 [Pseudomonas chlororaphis]|uniref:hypothetical protein n=1 Tax=Pseudomonas chlororaphis TaxID=587753 RepID=UPI0004AC0381|nr:hypothetical protein [Pseudomonas chlororaphis]AIC20587.1 hypothetical protein EY04_17235 [Pseudomonas chlororaphis]